MLCPECMAPLVSSDGRTATCRTHGGSYQILFARYAAPAAPGAFGAVPPALNEAPGAPLMPPPLPGADVLRAADARCLQHPASPAVMLCHNCRAPMCATCDFTFPGDIHLCPTCAVNPRQQMSPGRRKLIPWSIGLAILGIVGLVGMLVLSAAARADRDPAAASAIGVGFELLSFWPALIGLALGVATIDKRLKTPGTAWIGIIGCGAVVLIWLVLIVIGMTMRAAR